MSSEGYYIGVDVGTGSARAALVKRDGTVVASSTQETMTYRDPSDHRIFEQSTTNIWSGISKAIKACLAESGISASEVKGLGFDATCSLAVTDLNGEPVTVTKGDQLGQHGDRNIVLWADHRAEEEAQIINKTGSVVLDYVGGTISLEMEVPKILWLKRHMNPTLFGRCQFFDLPDFLTYRATSDNTRSACSVTCKCSFVPKDGWQADFFQEIGLGQLMVNECAQIGAAKGNVLTAGLPVGKGLSQRAAEEFGLVVGTPVGSGLIDAYAGWLGTVAGRYKVNRELSDDIPSLQDSKDRLAVIAGTSTCHIVQAPSAKFVTGVWGPYKNAVFSDWWMNEGGQSATGSLINFIITTHPAYSKLVALGKEQQKNIHAVLEDKLEELRAEANVGSLTELTKFMHMYPDFHGNRSPIADPQMRGSIVGLEMDDGINDLARKYNITLESIALQTRHIIEELNRPRDKPRPGNRHTIKSIFMSGGQAKNLMLMQLFANVCRVPVVLPADDSTAVVLGAAMLGRFAAEAEVDEGKVKEMSGEQQAEKLWNIMVEMTPAGTLVSPAASAKEMKLLDAKYGIFKETIEIQNKWRKVMEMASN